MASSVFVLFPSVEGQRKSSGRNCVIVRAASAAAAPAAATALLGGGNFAGWSVVDIVAMPDQIFLCESRQGPVGLAGGSFPTLTRGGDPIGAATGA